MLTAKSEDENSRTAETLCMHCGLPVPAARHSLKLAGAPSDEPSPADFCCSGCDFVYRLLHKHQLTQYYSLREKSSDLTLAVNPAQSSYAYLDQEDFRAKHINELGPDARCFEMTLGGVHCAACVWLIEKTPKLLPGLTQARLDFGKNRVRVTYDPSKLQPSKIAALFNSLGYSPSPFNADNLDSSIQSYERHFLIRLGIAGFCAGNTMMLAVSLYQGMFTGIPETIRAFLHWACLVLTLPVVTYAAWPFYRLGFGGLRFGTFHIDLPISLGIIVAFLASTVNTVRGGEHVYFDSICMLVFLLLGGRWLQHRRLQKIAHGLELLPNLLPASARRWDGTTWQEVLRESIRIGDRVEVRANEVIPADGKILEGSSTVNRALITGESRPIGVLPGDKVIAGTKNLSKPLVVEVEQVEDQTRIGKIAALVEDASRKRSHIHALTDRLSAYFVAGVLVLAAITFGLWYQAGFFKALDNTLALLVITCPCALGLAAPIAFSLALAQAARRGILLRSAEAIERITKIKEVFFDKTGTLTEGNCKVVESEFFSDSPAKLSPLLLELEKNVEHPVAQAIRDFAVVSLSSTDENPELESISILPGKGVSARDKKGHTWRLGAARFVAEELGQIAPEVQNQCAAISTRTLSPVLLSRDSEVLALFGIGDQIRAGSDKLIGWLAGRNVGVNLISGDAVSTTTAVARKLQFPAERVHGELAPEDKLALVKSAQSIAPCMMIGDGVNDAAALAAASVGVGITGGAESTLRVADAFLTRTDPDLIKLLFDGSERVMKVVRLNLTISLLYNVLGAAAAMLGVINPLLAAILMPLSSLTVIFTSSSFKTFS